MGFRVCWALCEWISQLSHMETEKCDQLALTNPRIFLQEYPFFRAGKEVSVLFQDKGWHQLIADDLTDNVLLIINLAVATSTGAFAWLLSTFDSHYYLLREFSDYHPYTAGFL